VSRNKAQACKHVSSRQLTFRTALICVQPVSCWMLHFCAIAPQWPLAHADACMRRGPASDSSTTSAPGLQNRRSVEKVRYARDST